MTPFQVRRGCWSAEPTLNTVHCETLFHRSGEGKLSAIDSKCHKSPEGSSVYRFDENMQLRLSFPQVYFSDRSTETLVMSSMCHVLSIITSLLDQASRGMKPRDGWRRMLPQAAVMTVSLEPLMQFRFETSYKQPSHWMGRKEMNDVNADRSNLEKAHRRKILEASGSLSLYCVKCEIKTKDLGP